jgi:hypothetical protein
MEKKWFTILNFLMMQIERRIKWVIFEQDTVFEEEKEQNI